MTTDQQSRTKRHLGLWALLVALLLIFGLTFIPPLVSVGRYKSRITQLVMDSLHRPVRLSSVELRILPRPGFVLSDLTVAEDPAYGTEPVLHANTVTTAIRLGSLWRGQLQLSRISVDEASLNLVHMPDGRWNIDALFSTAHSLSGPRGGAAVPPPYMEATNSRLNVKNGDEKLPFSLLNTDASLWQDSGVWHVRLRGQPARTDISLDLADTGILRAEAALQPAAQLSQMPLHLDVDWRQAQLGQLTRLLLGSDEGWRGNLTGEFHLDGNVGSTLVKSRLRASGVHREEFTPAEPIDFDATCGFRYLSADRAVRNLLCDSPVGEGRARLTGNLLGGDRPDVALELDRVPAQLGLDLLRTVRTNVAPGMQAAGSVSGKLSYAELEPGVAAPDPSREIPDHSRALRSAHPSRHAVAAAAPLASPLTGSFTVRNLALSGGALTTPLEIPRLTLESAAPRVNGEMALSTTASVPAGAPAPLSLAGRVSLDGFELAVRGSAALPRLRELLRIAGTPQSKALDDISGEPAALELTAAGPWLIAPSGPSAAGTGKLTSLVPPDPAAERGSMSGSIALHNATWRAPFLAGPLSLSAATLRFDKGSVRWSPVSFAYGAVKGTATVDLPDACDDPTDCRPRFDVRFGTLDGGVLQAAILGARDNATVFSTLLARFNSNAPSPWPELDGNMEATELRVGSFRLTDVAASLQIRPTGAEFDSLKAGFLGGSIAGHLSLSPGTRPTYALETTFKGLSPALLAPYVALEAAGNGIDGSGKLKLDGFTPQQLAASAQGDLRFEWNHGSVNAGPATASPANAAPSDTTPSDTAPTDAAPADPASLPPALSLFESWTGQAVIADGLLKIGPSQVRHGGHRTPLSATVTFGNPATVTFDSK